MTIKWTLDIYYLFSIELDFFLLSFLPIKKSYKPIKFYIYIFFIVSFLFLIYIPFLDFFLMFFFCIFYFLRRPLASTESGR
jgi:hypothetical protein